MGKACQLQFYSKDLAICVMVFCGVFGISKIYDTSDRLFYTPHYEHDS